MYMLLHKKKEERNRNSLADAVTQIVMVDFNKNVKREREAANLQRLKLQDLHLKGQDLVCRQSHRIFNVKEDISEASQKVIGNGLDH